MAFEQAAASNANMQIKEQAAYNYALCLHETSFSAFGESVTAFEKFLNNFRLLLMLKKSAAIW